MNQNCYLYNINQIIVESGLERKYKKFSKRLNKYLQLRYGMYYVGLQLYQNKEDSTQFYVIAYYKDRPGIDKAVLIIGEDIGRIYDEVWGDTVDRQSIFAFVNYFRISPPRRRRRRVC